MVAVRLCQLEMLKLSDCQRQPPIGRRAYGSRTQGISQEADTQPRYAAFGNLCAELLRLNRTFRATARSRLNAGAFVSS